MAPSKPLFQAQYYQSEESAKGPYAITRDETLWASARPSGLDEAMTRAKGWAFGPEPGNYKSTRVVELNKEGNPVSVAWASIWEAPLQNKVADQGASGAPGKSIKLHVWMDREDGPPDHWDWAQMLRGIFEGNNNAWDLEYGRPIETRGRQTLYSIKLNLWPGGKKPVEKWAWWKILGKDEDHQDEVEVVRAHPIEPREFPAGVDTLDCFYCGKTHLKTLTWRAYDGETDEMQPFCSCFCIDAKYDTDAYRITPDGDEFDEPGCVHEREKAGLPA